MKNKFNLKNLATLLPHNIKWSSFFNNDRPVDLEIGCGRPHFLFDRASNFPERNILGVEWKYHWVKLGQNHITRHNIGNAALFHGNAWLLVPLLFDTATIDQVFVNFPDPWWKMRHKKRLILNPSFIDVLVDRIKDRGILVLQTDVQELLSFYRELLGRRGAFIEDTEATEETIAQMLKAKSHREKKCHLSGVPIYRGVFRRRFLRKVRLKKK